MNTKAVWALVTALLALAALGGAVYAARYYDEVRLMDTLIAVPLALGFSVAAVLLNRRARSEHQRTLGRSGSPVFLGLVRLLGTIAFLLAVTAALALGGLRRARARLRVGIPRRLKQAPRGHIATIRGSCSRSATACERLVCGRVSRSPDRERDEDPWEVPQSPRRGAVRGAARRHVREGLPAHVRGLPRPRRSAVPGRVQLALRSGRGGSFAQSTAPSGASAGGSSRTSSSSRWPRSWP